MGRVALPRDRLERTAVRSDHAVQSSSLAFSDSGLFGYLFRRRKIFERFPVGIRVAAVE
jgi:hypothetical protein